MPPALREMPIQNTLPVCEILAPLAEAVEGRPYVIAQLGQSLDGRIATLTGQSRWINRDCALDHLHRLRAHVDAVVVGVRTVLADDPFLNVRRVPGKNPARVVIDPNGRLPATARCLANDGAPRLVVRSSNQGHRSEFEVIEVPLSDNTWISPKDIVDRLFERGFRKILVEGGARTVSSFVDNGIVDRLHVLVAPVILGSGMNGLSLAPIQGLADARRPLTRVHVLDDGDVLFDCDLRLSRSV